MGTKVIFRKDTETNEIIALFPDEIAQYGSETFHMCYAHIGQHNAYADNYAAKCTKRASPSEYKALKCELETLVGYTLVIVSYAYVVARWHNQYKPVRKYASHLYLERGKAVKARAEKRYANIYKNLSDKGN